MVGKKLMYGKDWGDQDEVKVYPSSASNRYWEAQIRYSNGESIAIWASEMAVYMENGKVVAIYY